MAISRTDVLTINVTVIAGLVVLLTLTNIGGNVNLIEKDLTQLSFNVVVVLALVPFTYSSLIEVNHELENRRFLIIERLKKKMDEAHKNNDQKLVEEIQQEINKISKKAKKLPLNERVLEEDEPTHRGLSMMRIGFIYILVALVIILLIPQIQLLSDIMN